MTKLKVAGGAIVTIVVIVFAAWSFMNPSMYVDNASKDDIKIYVDGKAIGTVKAKRHKKFDVKKGEHELGWSAADDDEAKNTIEAELSMGKPHLYSPGNLACYRLVVDTYGAGTIGSKEVGPLPIAEFYVLTKVDNWFTDNPNTVKIKKRNKGATRTALRRNKLCEEFSNCPLEQRKKLVQCELRAEASSSNATDFKKAFVQCAQPVAATCPRKN
jgi:hypothetical protein